jgi:Transglutaminase-like superfamily/Domain of unknown function (DUF5050)
MFRKTFISILLIFSIFFMQSFSVHTSLAATNSKAYKETYNQLFSAITSFKDTASFPSQSISYKNVGTIINQVLDDHPEIFYFQHKGTIAYSNGKIELKYKYPVKKIKEMVQNQDTMIKKIIKQTIKSSDSEFDKVKAIHDYIVLNAAYDWDNYKKGQVPDSSYTAYGLLINGQAVCEGYAQTMQLLLKEAGIEAHFVTGKANGGAHAWNLVKVDGEYYYVDATWDDPVPNRAGEISYKYFLTPAAALKKDHSWDEKPFPAATSTKYAYFQDFSSVKESGAFFYYANNKDDQKLYRMKKDGTEKKKLLNVRAPYFALTKSNIYFSNYSNGGYLYKSKLDGTQLKKINTIHSIDLYIEKDKLLFTNKTTGAKGSIKIN